MCVNNPYWRNYVLAVTQNIARTGMDGVFADEMTLHDYCKYDEAGFRSYIRDKYTARSAAVVLARVIRNCSGSASQARERSGTIPRHSGPTATANS